MNTARKRRETAVPESKPQVRCAIYTRKSTDDGLDQDFNSLDAQREAAEAFIQSQVHEGWTCLPDRYDDGGFSGGNIERPAVKRLLKDIEAGLIDCLVIYKVDRLSRSLLDFARMMETLEKNRVSFVSVTQQFNTSHSMGRLTLNILLSFAQFEREIIAERTRDKMSAARRKGKWTGGIPVLGYDVDPKGGRLVVNEEEAFKVKAIYELYLQRQSLLETANELNRRGWTTKQWITRKGREHRGRAFTKTNLFGLLSNPVYLGKVHHKGTMYEGEHEAIVTEEVWGKTQALLKRNGRSGGKEVRNKYGALLRGMLYCVPCEAAMSHTYSAGKQNKRYRYYVCTRAQKEGWDKCPSKSLPAAEIERFVVERIRSIGKDPSLIAETLEQARVQNRERMADLTGELKLLQGQLKRYNDEVKKIAASGAPGLREDQATTDRLADLQDRIRVAEQRVTVVKEECTALSGQTVEDHELATALGLFEPVWDSLAPREQARVLTLLLERVGYDGNKETVALTFRPTGIKTLAKETGSSKRGNSA